MENVHPFQSQQEIRAEARAWVLKFNSDTAPSEQDIAAMREWAKRSPVHRAELSRSETFWADADLLTDLAVPVGRHSNKTSGQLIASMFKKLFNLNPLGAWASATAASLAIAVAVLILPLSGQVGNGTYSTAIGEQKILSLTDHSSVQLDTNSQIRIAYSDGLRQIYLLNGKAHFDVAKNPQRPFEVYAGGGMVRAVGTAFSVHVIEQEVEVVVEEGRVDLARVMPSAPDAELPPTAANSTAANSTPANSPIAPPTHNVFLSLDKGQSALFNQNRQLLSQLAGKDLSRELAWRRGLLIFTGDPLHQVISEVNRYTKTTIEISDPELGALMIGGRFRVGELEALFDVLEAGFGVQISYIDKDHIQLRAGKE